MRIVAAIALTLFAAGALAQDASPTQDANKVYKWTDENGTVHFSPKPPENNKAEEVALRKGPAVVVPTGPTEEEMIAKRCKQHEENLALLADKEKTLTIGDGANKRELTAKERDDQLAIAKASLELCRLTKAAPTTP